MALNTLTDVQNALGSELLAQLTDDTGTNPPTLASGVVTASITRAYNWMAGFTNQRYPNIAGDDAKSHELARTIYLLYMRRGVVPPSVEQEMQQTYLWIRGIMNGTIKPLGFSEEPIVDTVTQEARQMGFLGLVDYDDEEL